MLKSHFLFNRQREREALDSKLKETEYSHSVLGTETQRLVKVKDV